MTKSILVFVILVLFVGVMIWFVVRKTGEVNQAADISSPIDEPASSLTDESDPTGGEFEPIQYDNGLVVQDVVVGSGKSAENGDTLSAHYIGALEDGTVFDESYSRGQPIQFVLGSGQLIQGWELGLVGMKEGGKRHLVIPSELGYGTQGAGNAIPPNATLVFEIELVSVTKQ
jgi:FKBP-type peptidyl-prolyl cis-trans isomerase